MAMQSSSTGSVTPDINVTPLIDVLLVLLIIFMVIVPQLPLGLTGAIPQGTATHEPAELPLRVAVHGDAGSERVRYTLGSQDVPADSLRTALQAALSRRQEHTLFLAADRALSYQQVAAVMGMGKEAGAAAIVLEPLAATR